MNSLTERVPLFIVYNENNRLYAEFTKDSNHYKIYGFLLVFLRTLEQDLHKNIKGDD